MKSGRGRVSIELYLTQLYLPSRAEAGWRERKYENGEDRTRDGRTTEEVVEERGGAALGEEVARELGDPGDEVDEDGGLDAAGLVRVRGGGECDEGHLRGVEDLEMRVRMVDNEREDSV